MFGGKKIFVFEYLEIQLKEILVLIEISPRKKFTKYYFFVKNKKIRKNFEKHI